MGVARVLKRVVQTTSQESQLVCHHVCRKMEMTVHDPEIQLHYRQDPHDILA